MLKFKPTHYNKVAFPSLNFNTAELLVVRFLRFPDAWFVLSNSKTPAKLCQWLRIAFIGVWREKKPNHICHHRCGQHTILVGSRGSVSLMRLTVRNSPSQHEEVAENPQNWRKNMAVSIIVIIYIFVVTFTHNAFFCLFVLITQQHMSLLQAFARKNCNTLNDTVT